MMKNFKLFTLLLTTHLIFSQNSVPSTGLVNFDTQLKIGNQVSPSGVGQITRMMLTPYRHTAGPWNIVSRDNADTAFLDFDYGTWGTALTMSSERNIGIGVAVPTAKFEVSNTFNTNANEVISSLTRFGTGTGGSSIVRFGYHETCDFEVNSGYTLEGLRFGSYFDLNIVNNKKGGDYGAINLVANESVKMTIKSNGNVGIGTQNPNSKLSVVGGLSKLTLSGVDRTFDNVIKYGYKSDLESQTALANRWHGIDATITAGAPSDNKLKFRLYAGGSANQEPDDVMVLVGNGNVGIGVPNPSNKLDVNGTIHSREVKVDLTGWSDFVFKKEYNLPTLEQVEKHIVEKGHLENIPSEKEVLENGINLGEMDAKLLQKIEELTLYMIEMKKENQDLKNAVEKQNKEIELLKIKK
ncbi:hypothetical protein [Flavobacterium branchiicola]|uniref:Peptidase S74 domain-containing protein n=1 Tax=Flavobacterium branchiicola TaxID=1114875 RepID=A0ABV9PDR3_9FLAO|nr:hypothetical protein [Flavobacterium branchiicola]